MRKRLIVGNWKMYNTPETRVFFEKFRPLVGNLDHCNVVVCPSFINLQAAVKAAEGTRIQIGAQNLHWAPFTGEISAAVIRAIGCSHVIVGYGERRQYFGETDDIVLKKTTAALEGGLTPIVCIGDDLDAWKFGRTERVLREQFEAGIAGLTPELFARTFIAYEPGWAIGTGQICTPNVAADVHRMLRQLVRKCFGTDAANDVHILYAGTVKPDYSNSLMVQPEIDGVIVGGASLDPTSFARIVNF